MKKLFLLAASAMMVIASCSKTDVIYQDETPQEIGLFSVAKNPTKAAIDGAAFTHTNMIVAAYLADGVGVTPGDYFTQAEFTKNGNVFTGSKYWPIQESTLNFLAIAPSVTGVSTTFGTLNNNQELENFANKAIVSVTGNAENQYDVMYAAGHANKTTGQSNVTNVPMTFNHAMAWVNFTFKATSGNITINSVTINGGIYDGTLTVTNNNYNADSENDEISVGATWTSTEDAETLIVDKGDDDGNTLTDEANPWGVGFLVIPCTATNFVINYTIDANGIAQTYDYTYSTGLKWDMAKKYTYNITMGLQEIKIAPGVQGWDSDINGNKLDDDETSITI